MALYLNIQVITLFSFIAMINCSYSHDISLSLYNKNDKFSLTQPLSLDEIITLSDEDDFRSLAITGDNPPTNGTINNLSDPGPRSIVPWISVWSLLSFLALVQGILILYSACRKPIAPQIIQQSPPQTVLPVSGGGEVQAPGVGGNDVSLVNNSQESYAYDQPDYESVFALRHRAPA